MCHQCHDVTPALHPKACDDLSEEPRGGKRPQMALGARHRDLRLGTFLPGDFCYDHMIM